MKLVTKKCTLWHEQITPNQHAPTNRLSTWHYNTSWSLLTFKWTNGHVAINSQLSSQDSNVSFMTTLICFMDHTSIKLLSKICLIYQTISQKLFLWEAWWRWFKNDYKDMMNMFTNNTCMHKCTWPLHLMVDCELYFNWIHFLIHATFDGWKMATPSLCIIMQLTNNIHIMSSLTYHWNEI